MLPRMQSVVCGILFACGADPAQLQTQTGSVTSPSFLEFESGHVRPIAMSPDGTQLFAVNTPNGTLEIFNITTSGLTFSARVPVGLEPVAVAARSTTEVWVVNHLSDSVSMVTWSCRPAGSPPRTASATDAAGERLRRAGRAAALTA